MNQITKDNYYSYENNGLILNHSIFKYISPYDDGSPEALKWHLAHRDADKEKNKGAKRFGKILHAYLENQESFVVDEGTRPSDAVVSIIDHAVKNINIAGVSYEEITEQLIESATLLDIYTSLSIKQKMNYISKGEEYFEFLKTTVDIDNSHILTVAEKELYDILSESWLNSPVYVEYSQNNFQKEIPIVWEENTNFGKVTCKALIDSFEHQNLMVIDDFKTCANDFMGIHRKKISIDPNEGTPNVVYRQGPIITYKYYRQLEFYRRGLMANGLFKDEAKLRNIMFQKVPPYKVEVYEIPYNWRDFANMEIENTISAFANFVVDEHVTNY